MEQSLPDLGPTVGSVEIGLFFALILTGISTMQAWNYYRDYPEDAMWLKLLVGGVYTADVAHTAALAAAIYQYTIAQFGNWPGLQRMTATTQASIVLGGAVCFAVQTYYCFRVQTLTGSRAIALVCWTLALVREGINIVVFATCVTKPQFAVWMADVRWQMITLHSVGAASDVAIAVFVCSTLVKLRSGIASSDRLVDKLVAFSIGSGFVTAVAAIVEIVTYLTMQNYVFLAIFCVMSKLFANSLLASLNERRSARSQLLSTSDHSHLASAARVRFGGTNGFEAPSTEAFRRLDEKV